ncbi:uncharacterized protein LOC122849549 [Aphidius gifuensis]|uniref:uncharacterized protein LOC122849549 n=1 Tax=Aphidius gifuensis TaxID=684658 RepID=UPI001CDC81CE|nr:uncharacterized protein LOC122849549 [Aphidius gifuensis]
MSLTNGLMKKRSQQESMEIQTKKLKIEDGAVIIYKHVQNMQEIWKVILSSENKSYSFDGLNFANGMLISCQKINNFEIYKEKKHMINFLLYVNDFISDNTIPLTLYTYEIEPKINFLYKKNIVTPQNQLKANKDTIRNLIYNSTKTDDKKIFLILSTMIKNDAQCAHMSRFIDHDFQTIASQKDLFIYKSIIQFDRRCYSSPIKEDKNNVVSNLDYHQFRNNCKKIYISLTNIILNQCTSLKNTLAISDINLYASTQTPLSPIPSSSSYQTIEKPSCLFQLSNSIIEKYPSLPENINEKKRNLFKIDQSLYSISHMYSTDAFKINAYKAASATTLLCGAPKLWLIVNPVDIENLKVALKNEYANENINSENDNIITKLKKNLLFLHPSFLVNNYIPMHFIYQRPGETVIIRDGVYYQTLNMGINFSETVYFLTPSSKLINMRYNSGLPMKDEVIIAVSRKMRKLHCDICKETFQSTECLSIHNRDYHNMHDSIVATCPICRLTINTTSLSNHLYTRHYENTGICLICDTFCLDKLFSRHYPVQHQVSISNDIKQNIEFQKKYKEMSLRVIEKSMITVDEILKNEKIIINNTKKENIEEITIPTIEDILKDKNHGDNHDRKSLSKELIFYQARHILYNIATSLAPSAVIQKLKAGDINQIIESKNNEEEKKKVFCEFLEEFSCPSTSSVIDRPIQAKTDKRRKKLTDEVQKNIMENFDKIYNYYNKFNICNNCKKKFRSYADYCLHNCQPKSCPACFTMLSSRWVSRTHKCQYILPLTADHSKQSPSKQSTEKEQSPSTSDDDNHEAEHQSTSTGNELHYKKKIIKKLEKKSLQKTSSKNLCCSYCKKEYLYLKAYEKHIKKFCKKK